jgi:hypothetical protein
MDIDSLGVYIELSLFSVDSHVVPGGPLLALVDDRLDMRLEIADILSDENERRSQSG